MPNTKPVGVAYEDPYLSGATIENSIIGGTTPAAGTFSTVSATNVVSTGDLYVASATVAATGSTQTDAAQIAGGFTLVTAADATKGVKLPAAAAGRVVIIKNGDAANAILKVWPSSGDGINAVAVDSSYSMAAKTSAMFVAYDATTWYTIPLVAS